MLYRAIARRGTTLHIAALRELLLDYICTCSSLVIIINADWLIKRHTEDCMAVLSFPIITLTTGICTMLVTILINRILHPHHHSAGLRAAAELWVLMITLWDAARHWRQHPALLLILANFLSVIQEQDDQNHVLNKKQPSEMEVAPPPNLLIEHCSNWLLCLHWLHWLHWLHG